MLCNVCIYLSILLEHFVAWPLLSFRHKVRVAVHCSLPSSSHLHCCSRFHLGQSLCAVSEEYMQHLTATAPRFFEGPAD